MLKLSKALVTAGTVLYSAPVVGWLIIRFLKGESAWPMVGALNAIGSWWFLPIVLLLPVALLVRARQASVMLLGLLAIALTLVGRDFVPNFAAASPDEARRVRVLSYNALVSNTAYDAVEEMIRRESPDIIAIQELSHEMSAEITARVGADYPYQLLYPWSDPRGTGIWSRFPLQEGPVLNRELWERWALAAFVDVGGTPLYLFNVHLWPTNPLDREQYAYGIAQQHAQVVELVTMVEAAEGAVLVVGDFNASPTNETYGKIDEALDDVWRTVSVGPGFTFPSGSAFLRGAPPFLRIDYMWVRGPVEPLELRVLPDAGSDHLPLMGEFVLP